MTSNTNLDIVPLSVRIYRAHKELIDRAAALVEGRSPSDYVRETMAMQAALDLGVELPNVPEINRGRAGGLVNQAAAKLGMTREEFEQLAVRHMAAQTLEANAIVTPAPGTREVRPGAYSERDISERVAGRRTSEVRALAPAAQQRRAR